MSNPANREAVVLGFRAFDPHELLLHFLAERLGHYERAGLAVSLRDITFFSEDKLEPHIFSTACGAALLGRAQGARRKVVFVATERPMFWMYARAGTRDLEQLRQTRIATFPPGSPPWLMHREALKRRGLDPDRDVQLEPARDDVARLGLLRSGQVAAALLSSFVPPAKAQSLGLTTVLFLGDEIRIPTTGLVASEEILGERPELVRRLAEAFRRSLASVRESPANVLPVLEQLLDATPQVAASTYDVVRDCFTIEGRASAQARTNAIELVSGGDSETAKRIVDLYDESFLPA